MNFMNRAHCKWSILHGFGTRALVFLLRIRAARLATQAHRFDNSPTCIAPARTPCIHTVTNYRMTTSFMNSRNGLSY
jgi:hypothetical protein